MSESDWQGLNVLRDLDSIVPRLMDTMIGTDRTALHLAHLGSPTILAHLRHY